MAALYIQNIKRDAEITPIEIEGLRLAVGWDTNEGKYEDALKKTYTHFSVKRNNLLISYARIVSDGTIYAFIVDLMVHPDYQRHGIGKVFLQHIISQIEADHIKYIQLTFDPKLKTFYKDCGFEIIEAGSILNS